MFFGKVQIGSWLVAAVLLSSCTNDLNQIQRITYDPKSPNEVSKNMSIYFADYGYAKINIFAKLAETYANPHVTILKDSLKVDFFDENGEISSTLTAKYGEVNHETAKIFVRDSVQLTNHKDQRTMYTSVLYWNQLDSVIYTDQRVCLKSPKGIAFGSSLHAKQDFTTYKITDPKGAYEFDQEK